MVLLCAPLLPGAKYMLFFTGVSMVFLSLLNSVDGCFDCFQEPGCKILFFRVVDVAGDCWALGGSFETLPDGGILDWGLKF